MSPRPTESRPPGEQAAVEAGLRYSSDDRPGITRRRSGRGFTYRRPDGSTVRDPDTLARIRSIAIPPAWTDVWIAQSPRGHIQATGRDARGRKQYRYHAEWRSTRDEAKYDRVIGFARALPRIRAQVDADLSRAGLPREKVLALVVRLLELTLLRVGNDEYRRLNGSFGLTTLRRRHAEVDGSVVRFRFRGKGGRVQETTVRDRRLARAVARCQELPGQELFAYVDDAGDARDVRSDDVNDYLRSIAGDAYTAKDFRTWAATVLAWRALRSAEPAEGPAARRSVTDAIDAVAERLGNTTAVCRSSYVHPGVVEAYLGGDMGRGPWTRAGPGSKAEEAAVIRLLRRQARARPSTRRRRNGGR
jgi:DNA topoisomerase-1